MTTFEDMQTQIYVLLLRFSILSGKITFLNIEQRIQIFFSLLFYLSFGRAGSERLIAGSVSLSLSHFNLEMLR